jgi:hypothetical protein
MIKCRKCNFASSICVTEELSSLYVMGRKEAKGVTEWGVEKGIWT